MPRTWLTLIPLLLLVGACSDDHSSANGATTTTLPPALSSTTLPAGAPDPHGLFPDTPIVSGQNATVNGAFSSGPDPKPGDDPDGIGCQWVTRSDGKKVAVQFPDVYASPDGTQFLIGPPNYTPGNDFNADPNLVHSGDKVIVAGEVDESESACAASTSYPGLVVVSSVWSKNNG
jgi:hypothetical protein